MIEPVTVIMIFRIICALLLGMCIGVERIARHKAAGIRTYSLVAMAAALFVVISELVIREHVPGGSLSGLLSVSPVAVLASIVTGVGFLGAGLIIHTKEHVDNLTTACAVWAAAAIGVACGFGYVFIALCATLLILFVLSGTRGFEDWLKTKSPLDPGNHPPGK